MAPTPVPNGAFISPYPILASTQDVVVRPNGTDDYDNLQYVFDNMRNKTGATITLTAGAFYHRYMLQLKDYNGVLQGAGMRATSLTEGTISGGNPVRISLLDPADQGVFLADAQPFGICIYQSLSGGQQSNVEIKDLGFLGSEAPGYTGLYFGSPWVNLGCGAAIDVKGFYPGLPAISSGAFAAQTRVTRSDVVIRNCYFKGFEQPYGNDLHTNMVAAVQWFAAARSVATASTAVPFSPYFDPVVGLEDRTGIRVDYRFFPTDPRIPLNGTLRILDCVFENIGQVLNAHHIDAASQIGTGYVPEVGLAEDPLIEVSGNLVKKACTVGSNVAIRTNTLRGGACVISNNTFYDTPIAIFPLVGYKGAVAAQRFVGAVENKANTYTITNNKMYRCQNRTGATGSAPLGIQATNNIGTDSRVEISNNLVELHLTQPQINAPGIDIIDCLNFVCSNNKLSNAGAALTNAQRRPAIQVRRISSGKLYANDVKDWAPAAGQRHIVLGNGTKNSQVSGAGNATTVNNSTTAVRVNQAVALTGTTPGSLGEAGIVSVASVRSEANNGGTLYALTTDYTVDLVGGTITRAVGSTIPSGSTVYVIFTGATNTSKNNKLTGAVEFNEVFVDAIP